MQFLHLNTNEPHKQGVSEVKNSTAFVESRFGNLFKAGEKVSPTDCHTTTNDSNTVF